MFGLSLSTLPFLNNGSDKNDAPVVLTYDQVEEIGRELMRFEIARSHRSVPKTVSTYIGSSRRNGVSRLPAEA